MTNQRQKSQDRAEATAARSANTRQSPEGENPKPDGMPLATAGGGYGGNACTSKTASEEGECSEPDSD